MPLYWSRVSPLSNWTDIFISRGDRHSGAAFSPRIWGRDRKICVSSRPPWSTRCFKPARTPRWDPVSNNHHSPSTIKNIKLCRRGQSLLTSQSSSSLQPPLEWPLVFLLRFESTQVRYSILLFIKREGGFLSHSRSVSLDFFFNPKEKYSWKLLSEERMKAWSWFQIMPCYVKCRGLTQLNVLALFMSYPTPEAYDQVLSLA